MSFFQKMFSAFLKKGGCLKGKQSNTPYLQIILRRKGADQVLP